ncbi:MAG: Esterase, hydrolase-type domain [Ferruginibacter sp.]|uniref:hypothetical protein n=1 Tax=Ferruginibacter sp. TaxID=1940288 RepID=UPI002658282E|nr:hypothetical protein [Ferruginibacter sp.]MDB5280406.1 Esterase, hydrolase-type domain [Ferruginibacter sp.]
MLKELFVKLGIFLILLIILDKGIGYFIEKIYFSQDHGYYYRTTYVFEKATPDIIILGASKASHHYVSKMITDSLKHSCFNAGEDGYFILYQEASLRCMLKRKYIPKLLLLDLNDDEFEKNTYKTEDRLSILFPYYQRHPEIRDIVELKSPFEKYKLMSTLYSFNTVLLPALSGSIDLNNRKESEKKYAGYVPLTEKWNGTIKTIESHGQLLDSVRIKAFEEIIKLTRENNINLVVIVSPAYKVYKGGYNPTTETLQRISEKNQIPFWNYINDTTYLNNRNYFKDVRHMNDDGAQIFTANVITRIKALKAFQYVASKPALQDIK